MSQCFTYISDILCKLVCGATVGVTVSPLRQSEELKTVVTPPKERKLLKNQAVPDKRLQTGLPPIFTFSCVSCLFSCNYHKQCFFLQDLFLKIANKLVKRLFFLTTTFSTNLCQMPSNHVDPMTSEDVVKGS